MINNDLIDELDATSFRIGGITKLLPDVANAYLQKLANAYVADPSYLRWWESLKVCAAHVAYGDADGLFLLEKLLVERRNDAILVVTDDEEPPWFVYSGNTQKIIMLLRESRFFEYILAAHDMSWIVFDTHMNSLVFTEFDWPHVAR